MRLEVRRVDALEAAVVVLGRVVVAGVEPAEGVVPVGGDGVAAAGGGDGVLGAAGGDGVLGAGGVLGGVLGGAGAEAALTVMTPVMPPAQ